MVVAVLVAIVIVWLRPHAPGGGEAAVSTSTAGQVAPSASSRAEPGGSADAQDQAADVGVGPTPGSAFVHVVGEVADPGVVELPSGARVRDALDAAGGPTKRAVLAGVNLARVVVDGEQITVPDTAEAEMSAAPGGVDTAESGGSGGTGANGASPGALVNLNTADAAALETLPRVGPALAQRIIDWRAANGAFTSVDQLLEVSGIGEKTLEGFRDRVTV
ncbi:ComEA family DNA-binding protein [Leucobacter tardus]|uniref:ComEA family DNA-binding protein n=2 Tax=Leucobacter tardus TaxID=501483 RepID=A0A939QLE6_9MICO|nr:ComEA family DNA-binding protein [Leucobacter tardus]